MSQLVNYISENNLRTVADLETRVSAQQEKLDARSAACKSVEAKMKETAELLRQAQNYADTKPIYDKWYRIKFKGENYRAYMYLAKSLMVQWRSSHRLLVLPPFGHWYTVFAVLNGEFKLRTIAALLGYG